MADTPFYYANSGDLTLDEVLNNLVLDLLQDDASLPNHPALFSVGDLTASGSTTIQQSAIAQRGNNIMAEVTEGTATAETDTTDASYTVAVALQALVRKTGDLFTAVNALRQLTSPERFAMDAMAAANGRLVELIAAIIDGFTNTSGTTGNTLDLDTVLAAETALRVRNVRGLLMAGFHGKQVGDLRRDIAQGAVGAFQMSESAQRMLVLSDDTYQGRLLEQIDVFRLNRVNTINSGADYGGAIWGRGAVLHGHANLPPKIGKTAFSMGLTGNGARVEVEFGRPTMTAHEDTMVYRAIMGASMGIDNAGQTIVSAV